MSFNIELKRKLYEKCQAVIDHKIRTAQQSMEEVQAASSEDTKSSAGDKYETGRAMLHLEKEKYASQLAEGLQLKARLEQIDFTRPYSSIQPGCLFTTNQGRFFVAISAGKIKMDREEYFTISLASPIGQALHKLGAGSEIIFMGKKHTILNVV